MRKWIFIGRFENKEYIQTYLLENWGIITKFIEIPEINRLERIGLNGTYELICQEIEKLGYEFIFNSSCFLNLPFSGIVSAGLNPLLKIWKKPDFVLRVASLLILTFPEINWVFPSYDSELPTGPIKNHFFIELRRFDYLVRNENIWRERRNNLFDHSGIRNLIRKNMISEDETRGLLNSIQIRDELCVSIDEEKKYGIIHAYVAYKTGFRCDLVTTEKELSNLRNEDEIYQLSFEDLYLNFVDRGETDINVIVPHLSDIKARYENIKILGNIPNKILITVGHGFVPIERLVKNRNYIDLKKTGTNRTGIKIIYKPTSGIFNIIRMAGLMKRYLKLKKLKCIKVDSGEKDVSSHSTPGRILMIVDRLMKRSSEILNDSVSTDYCIYGAMLALEAQELLGSRTPTTSLEAIALKHQLEVKAECMFYGVAYNIDMENRFKEIELEVEAVSKWFHPSIRKRSALNAQLGILTELVEILRDYGQFDEELQCLKRIRKLNRQFYFLNRPWLRFIQPVRAYIENLVSSFPLFIGALIFWPLFFGVISYLINTRDESKSISTSLWQHFANSCYTFFGLQPISTPIDSYYHIISVITVLFGFLHLGIFISYLYNLIFRK